MYCLTVPAVKYFLVIMLTSIAPVLLILNRVPSFLACHLLNLVSSYLAMFVPFPLSAPHGLGLTIPKVLLHGAIRMAPQD